MTNNIQEQGDMFDNDSKAKISWHGTLDWYFIEHRNNKHECLYLDDKGRRYYDAKQFSIIVPLVFNDKRTAHHIARREKGRVRKFPYRLQWYK